MENNDYKMSDLKKDIDQMKKESKSQYIESKVQTIGLLLVFVFGIATLHDVFKKLK